MPGPLEPLIFGYRTIWSGIVKLVRRADVNFNSADFLITDDPVNKRTNIQIKDGSGGGGVPGGDDRELQLNDDGSFDGTPQLTAQPYAGNDLIHKGRPMHQEDWVIFRAPGETSDKYTAPERGEERNGWSSLATEDSTTHTVALTVYCPYADATIDGDPRSGSGFGDCQFSMSVRATARGSAGYGGGTKSIEVRANRASGGTLSTPTDSDTTAVAPDFDFVLESHKLDNDTIQIRVTGLTDATVNFCVSAHVQIVRDPAH